MTNLTRTDIEHLGRLAEEATPGPWEENFYRIARSGKDIWELVCLTATNNARRTPQARKDGEFIAAARNTVPQLCRQYIDVAERLERVRARVNDLFGYARIDGDARKQLLAALEGGEG